MAREALLRRKNRHQLPTPGFRFGRSIRRASAVLAGFNSRLCVRTLLSQILPGRIFCGNHSVAALLFGGIKGVVRALDQIANGFVSGR